VVLLDSQTELALCQKARAGSRAERAEAFEQIFRELRAQVFALCLHLTGSRAEAEDALQECFLSVYQAIGSFRGEARLATWVYRIAVRSALSVKARRRANHASLDEAARTPAPGEDPEAQAATREDVGRFLDALARLPEEHRVVLSLFAVEGLDHAQIAEIVGVPPGTVWSRLHHARKRLGALMARVT
jgi:RNA polymerase sigma-70 factor (ECF subfamily)